MNSLVRYTDYLSKWIECVNNTPFSRSNRGRESGDKPPSKHIDGVPITQPVAGNKGHTGTIRTCNHCAARRTAAILSDALDCLFVTAIIRREREQIRNLECEAWPGPGVLV